MNILEVLRQWILTYPGWDGGTPLQIGGTDPVPPNAGLFFEGLEEVSRQTDVQGNVLAAYRCRFRLRRVVSASNTEHAAWLMGFYSWLQGQCACGKAPTFGCLPRLERMQVYDGGLESRTQDGAAVYAVGLWVEFANYYEGWVDDGTGI